MPNPFDKLMQQPEWQDFGGEQQQPNFQPLADALRARQQRSQVPTAGDLMNPSGGGSVSGILGGGGGMLGSSPKKGGMQSL